MLNAPHWFHRFFVLGQPVQEAESLVISLVALVEPQLLDPFLAVPRAIGAADLPELSNLHGQAYAHGTSDPVPAQAASSISAIFDGAQGRLIPEASLLTRDAEGRFTAAIVTTERVFGPDSPKTAFIAELFTHPEYRRQGLAEILLSHAMQALHETGHKTLAVTVKSSNAAALALYLSRDFRRFTPPAANND
jgi:N-alpha-acetyltransferase 10/11